MCSLRHILTPLSLPLAVVTLLSLAACGSKHDEPQKDGEVLVAVGDSTLRLNDVLLRIPRGLNPADSARMFKNIVDTWVRDLVLTEVAEQNSIDIAKIDRMVESYRNSLIINEYLSMMDKRSGSDIPESSVKQYYADHQDELVLTQPLIKGAYIKVAETDPNLGDLRRWLAEFSDKSFDNIERTGLRQATGYLYFRDEWQEWNVIAEQIPYRFFDADAFVRSTRNFETAADGSVYLLHISEYLQSGEKIPYEFARQKIREILRANDVAAVRAKLISDIYREKIKEGMLKPGLYDPVKGEIKENNNRTKLK